MLSDRIRPNSEAAPWVVDEVKKLEALLRRCFSYMDHDSSHGVIALRRDVEKALAPGGEQLRQCNPCDGAVTFLMIQHCGFSRCPHKPKCICTLEDREPRGDCPVHNPK